MKAKTLSVLEYNKIIEQLIEQAGSEMTKKTISELKPFTDVSEIRDYQAETTEAVREKMGFGLPEPKGSRRERDSTCERERREGSSSGTST